MFASVYSVAARTVIAISDAYPYTVELLCTRYKGLKLLLTKWEKRGFDRDLRRLQLLLDAGSVAQADLAVRIFIVPRSHTRTVLLLLLIHACT